MHFAHAFAARNTRSPWKLLSTGVSGTTRRSSPCKIAESLKVHEDMAETMQKLRGSSRQHVAPETAQVYLPSEVEVCSRRGRCWDGSSSHHCLQGSSGGPVKSQDTPVAQADLARAAGANGPERPPRGDGAAIHHWISIPCELGPLRAASPHDDWKHSHVCLEDSVIPCSLRSGERFEPLSFPSLCRGQT